MIDITLTAMQAEDLKNKQPYPLTKKQQQKNKQTFIEVWRRTIEWQNSWQWAKNAKL